MRAARAVPVIWLAACLPYARAQQPPPLDAFGERAARAFGAVARATAINKLPAEGLTVISIEEDGGKIPFVVAGAKPGEVQAITCEKSQMLALLAGNAGLATANIGECVKDADRIREGAEAARDATDAFLRNFPARVQRQLAEDRQWERIALPRSMQGYAYTVFIAGHGFATASTAVLYDEVRKVAFVAQGGFDPLCGTNAPAYPIHGKSSPLCPRTSRALLEVTKALANVP